MPGTEPRDDDDALDLPPLDDEDASPPSLDDEIDEEVDASSAHDPFDDAETGGDPAEELQTFAEEGLVVGADDLEGVGASAADAELLEDLEASESVLGEEEEDRRIYEGDVDDDLATATAEDAGEEGPLDGDEDLREEDLPALDEDEGGDVPDEALFERSVLGPEAELLWADRGWERVPPPATSDEDDVPSPLPGDEPDREARDATWRQLDAGARVTAVALVPGGSVVLALAAAAGGKARLVRIQPDGTARVVAEIEAGSPGEEDAEVLRMRWDEASATLAVHGNFEPHAFRP